MPIYAYRCESCGHAKDVLQKMSDPVLSTCPSCGAESFKKQLTAAGFQLKGSGWYVTDFRGGASGAGSAPAAGAEGGTTPASTGSGDAAPAAPSAAPSGGDAASGGSTGGCGTGCTAHAH